jgi:hypothetical protein
MFYMISGVQRLWQIFRLELGVIAPCTTEPGAPDSGPPVLPDTEQRQQ